MLLTKLNTGEKAIITELVADESKRRRLLDLGLIPGTKITAKRKSPSGDPTAYLFRGTIIALRSEEAGLIHIKMLD